MWKFYKIAWREISQYNTEVKNPGLKAQLFVTHSIKM